MTHALRVRDRMHRDIVAVAWHDSAEAAFARMRAAGLDALPVVNGPAVIGLIERDATQAARRGGNWLESVPVASLMRPGPFCCHVGQSLDQALAIMDRLEADVLAVLDGTGRLVGVLGRDQGLAPKTGRVAMAAAG